MSSWKRRTGHSGQLWKSCGGKWEPGRCSFSNSLLVVQRNCQGKETCHFKANVELFLDHGVTDPCPDLQNRLLAVDYGCVSLSRPAPLFDAKRETFRSGVTPHYLLVADHTTSCAQKSNIEVSATEAAEVYNLNDARRVCNLHHQCSYFIWDFKSRQATFCSGDGWKRTEKSHGYTIGVKPSEFSIPGYAVYLNYAGICTESNIVDKKGCINHVKDGATLCSTRKQCDFWTASISPGLVSLPGYNHHLWLCSGPPTMMPRDGFVFAAKAQNETSVQPEALLEELARPSEIDLFRFPQGYPTASEVDRAKSLKQAEDSRLAGQIY
ncbi:UNVERIFIED_CONTAM: hypothetical protein HHA_232290 [Hammondia hammondi]|eukprot:XP_008885621.1 hypothetical protein HHA_232290 [Hammondia hammondi]